MNRPQAQYDRLNARLPYAGGFESALIEAWMKADDGNKTRLENAFDGTMFNLKMTEQYNDDKQTSPSLHAEGRCKRPILGGVA